MWSNARNERQRHATPIRMAGCCLGHIRRGKGTICRVRMRSSAVPSCRRARRVDFRVEWVIGGGVGRVGNTTANDGSHSLFEGLDTLTGLTEFLRHVGITISGSWAGWRLRLGWSWTSSLGNNSRRRRWCSCTIGTVRRRRRKCRHRPGQ